MVKDIIWRTMNRNLYWPVLKERFTKEVTPLGFSLCKYVVSSFNTFPWQSSFLVCWCRGSGTLPCLNRVRPIRKGRSDIWWSSPFQRSDIWIFFSLLLTLWPTVSVSSVVTPDILTSCVYYESRNRELKRRLVNKGRCDERLKALVFYYETIKRELVLVVYY